MKKTIAALSFVAGAVMVCTPRTMAQSGDAPSSQSTATSQSGIDRDIQMLRQDLRSKKKQTIATNLQLTDADATKFWPVYDQYVVELTKINDEKYAVIAITIQKTNQQTGRMKQTTIPATGQSKIKSTHSSCNKRALKTWSKPTT